MRFAILLSLSLLACGPPAGTAFLRAYAAGDRDYTAGRYLDAAVEYEEAAKIAKRDRDRDEAIYSAAVARFRGGDVDGALKHFDALSKEDPPGERAIRSAFRAAEIRIDRGDKKRGYDDLEKILKRAPEHGVSRRALLVIVNGIVEKDGEAAAIAWEEKLYPAVATTRLGEELCYDIAHRREKTGDIAAALKGFLTCADTYPYPKGALWDDSLWHASRLYEKQGDLKMAIAVLERMLAAREKSYMSGSYNRPRMSAAQFRIAELQRDALKDPLAARASFHRVYVEHQSSILRPKALYEEAKLAKEANDTAAACSLADKLLNEFQDSRYARRADDVCAAAAPRAEALRKARAEKRAKSVNKTDDED
jgi:tetratricopeptide (TPR) repeat protein